MPKAPTPDPVSLDAWLAARPKTTRCKTCNLPADVRAEVDRGLRSKIGVPTLLRYLRDEHRIVLSDGALNNHRYAGHHES